MPATAVVAGDLCAIGKLAHAETGDTLSAIDDPRVLKPWSMPEPLLPVAIVARSKADEDKLSQALGRRIRIRFIADHGNLGTPAERRAQAQVDAQANAVASMETDPFVQTLKREFDARVIPQSIKPVEPGT